MKPTFLVTDMNFNAIAADGMARESKSESAAVKQAKSLLVTSNGEEAWIWKLSHVVSVGEPEVQKIK